MINHECVESTPPREKAWALGCDVTRPGPILRSFTRSLVFTSVQLPQSKSQINNNSDLYYRFMEAYYKVIYVSYEFP
jgi:hypothetical protein